MTLRIINMFGITCIELLFNTKSFHLMVKYSEMPRGVQEPKKKLRNTGNNHLTGSTQYKNTSNNHSDVQFFFLSERLA